jgi:hypothetical protein
MRTQAAVRLKQAARMKPAVPVKHRRGRLRIAIVAVAVAGAALAANLGQASATVAAPGLRAAKAASAQAVAIRSSSGLPWVSGVYLTADTPAAVAAFAAWRGRPVDLVEAWLDDKSWATITDPAWLYQRWAGSGYRMAFAVPMLPNVGGVSIQACANGAYNAHWRQFGKVISAHGLGSSIIRLGWEFNGKWERWNASNPAAWARCWRQAVTAAWSTAPHLRWDWNVNRGVSSALADPARAYPGNAYVSIVGIDSYDWWPPVTTAAAWQRQLNGPQGLNYWLAFAKAHGKKLSVPEWGNTTTGGDSGGDNPAYVRYMLGFFKAHAASLAYESNFQCTGGNYGTNGIYGATRTPVPKAAAAYKAGF